MLSPVLIAPIIGGAVMLIVYTQLAKNNLNAKYGSTIANMCETTVFANFDRDNLTSTHQPPHPHPERQRQAA